MNKKYLSYLLAGFIALLTILVYLPSLQNDFVDWDDNRYVYDNPYIRAIDIAFFKWAFYDIYYAHDWIPLTWISHAADYAIWGLDPLGHHLTNIILHGLNTFLPDHGRGNGPALRYPSDPRGVRGMGSGAKRRALRPVLHPLADDV
jgi:hypothetical protein